MQNALEWGSAGEQLAEPVEDQAFLSGTMPEYPISRAPIPEDLDLDAQIRPQVHELAETGLESKDSVSGLPSRAQNQSATEGAVDHYRQKGRLSSGGEPSNIDITSGNRAGTSLGEPGVIDDGSKKGTV